jgi:hypothetical protein
MTVDWERRESVKGQAAQASRPRARFPAESTWKRA